MKKILLGGSPCTFWSISQAPGTREVKAEGKGWELFLNYLIAKKKFRPDFFLYENNKSASRQIKEQIQRELKTELMYINSDLVSAQNRERFYIFNWNAEQPEDRKIFLQDIILSGTAEREKAYCLDASYYKGGNIKSHFKKHRRTQIFETKENGKPSFEVKDGAVFIEGKRYKANLKSGIYYPRNMTTAEAAKLQTMPENYCKSISQTQAIKCFGNGWTAEVIIHLLKEGLKEVQRDEKLIVLSMYDGIGTGRYCLERLGFSNITYYAYEIDKHAIKVALDNYPDIIEKGDAFQLRNDDWNLNDDLNGPGY